MPERASLQELLAQVNVTCVADIRGAAEAMQRITAAKGLRVAIADNIASKYPLTDEDGGILAAEVFGWNAPEERWWADTKLALSSPTARACRYESEPFWANEQGCRTRQPNRYLEAMDLGSFEKRALTKAALVIPVHLPFGQIGIASYSPVDTAIEDLSDLYEAYADELMSLSHRFIAGCVKAHRTRQWLPADCQLTKREVECLRWASIGKTDREISMILGRSHATVRFHIQNAGEKLDAVNRSQTIFKAAQLGYLGYAA